MFVRFLGFPAGVETAEKDPNSKRRPSRKVLVDEESPYHGLNSQTRGWMPGEVRKLVDETDAEGAKLFDAEAVGERLVSDFGEKGSGWAHLPEKHRKLFGFRKSSAAAYSKQG
jgi:hypothetical protein